MTQVVQSYRYPLESLHETAFVDAALILLPDNVRIVFLLECEGTSFPGAIHACAEATRILREAGLPPVAWRDGSDACPGCGRPEEHAGTDGNDGEEQLEL